MLLIVVFGAYVVYEVFIDCSRAQWTPARLFCNINGAHHWNIAATTNMLLTLTRPHKQTFKTEFVRTCRDHCAVLNRLQTDATMVNVHLVGFSVRLLRPFWPIFNAMIRTE